MLWKPTLWWDQLVNALKAVVTVVLSPLKLYCNRRKEHRFRRGPSWTARDDNGEQQVKALSACCSREKIPGMLRLLLVVHIDNAIET